MSLTYTKAMYDYLVSKNMKLQKKRDGFSTFNDLAVGGTSVQYDTLKLVLLDQSLKIVSAKTTDNAFGRTFTIATGAKEATLVDDTKVIKSFVVVTESALLTWALTQAHIDSVTSKNATLFVNDVLATPTTIKDDDVFKIIPNEGYQFVENKVQIDLDIINPIRNFTVNPELNIATYIARPTALGGNINTFRVETVLLPPENVRGFNNIYKIDKEQLKEVTKQRFKVVGGTVETPTTTDLGINILGLIELPLNIEASLIVGQQKVYLGDYQTTVNADFLSVDVLNVKLGKIIVPETHNNVLDFLNTTAIIHLPYSNAINLDINYVIGEEIEIEYNINMYDGLATINIYSSKLDDIIATANIDMNIRIPFANMATYPSGNAPNDVKLGGYNGILKPFIEIVRNESDSSNKFFTIPITEEKVLLGNTGYIEVQNIDLKCNATSSEKDMIINALKQGTIIK